MCIFLDTISATTLIMAFAAYLRELACRDEFKLRIRIEVRLSRLGWGFTKLLRRIRKIFHSFGPKNLEIIEA